MISHRTILRKESLEGRNWLGAYHRFVIIGGLCHKEVKAEWREDLDMTSFKTCPQEFLSHLHCWVGAFIPLSSLFSPTYLFVMLRCQPPPRTVLGVTLTTRRECSSQSPSSSDSSMWLSWFPPKSILPTGFCLIRALYSHIPSKLTFWNLCPRFFKAASRCRMIHLEGQKLFTCSFPDPQLW